MPGCSIGVPLGPAVRLGFYGKIPSRGDFVRHGLSRDLIANWDGWLQKILIAIRCHNGADIAAIWDAAPVWHLALQAGLCGPAPMLGVMLPSTDRSGRRFPLLCAAEGAADGNGSEILTGALEMIGRSSIEDGKTPQEIRERLGDVSVFASHPAETLRITGARWWRPDAMQEELLGGMPNAETFLRLVTSA